MTENNKLKLTEYTRLAEAKTDEIFRSSRASKVKYLGDAMAYSVSAGGKRIRPALTMEFCRLCGGNSENAMSAAAAIEMIHTFSLIHDDLPCMDNDDFRRGKPSCHKAFGEAEALLAGDALENLAFGIIAEDEKLTDEAKIQLVRELSDATGSMIDGQAVDLTLEASGNATAEKLLDMYRNKTCALLKCACAMGCICGGADEEKLAHAKKYAEKMGLAFQIIDDILDIVGDEKELGKPTGSDAQQNKTTFASLIGIDEAKKNAERFSQEALAELKYFDDNDFLSDLTVTLLDRKN